jgi:NAD(P)-dependent dehydrogenase (short-subunit alcohol dehydrogenase family)
MLPTGSARATTWDSIEPTALLSRRNGDLLIGKTGYLGRYTGYQDNGSPYRMQYYTNHADLGAINKTIGSADGQKDAQAPRLKSAIEEAIKEREAAKAALESTSRYLAKELGGKNIRCNLVAAGPIKTMAAKSIPGFQTFEDVWSDRAPLGWDVNDSTAVARACVALLSDWFPATTAEVIHVDGGYHAMGV